MKKKTKPKRMSKAQAEKLNKLAGRILNTTLYCYVQKTNADWAQEYGTKLFGSHSAYINVLIAKDRGVKKPRLGTWKARVEQR